MAKKNKWWDGDTSKLDHSNKAKTWMEIYERADKLKADKLKADKPKAKDD